MLWHHQRRHQRAGDMKSAGPGRIDRYRGCLVGLAFGDALGAPYEFETPPFTVEPAFGPGVFGTAPGHPTDDTELALRLARSIVEHARFVPDDYAAKLVAWAESGPPDIGNQTALAAHHHREHGAGPPESAAAGNGSLMAAAPLALLMADASRSRRNDAAAGFADITHPNVDARSTNRAFFEAIVQSLAGRPVAVESRPVADPARESIGWCRLTYALATEALADTTSADDAHTTLIRVVELGGDTDTNAAVTGALLGARWGMAAWPAAQVAQLAAAPELLGLADRIHALSR